MNLGATANESARSAAVLATVVVAGALLADAGLGAHSAVAAPRITDAPLRATSSTSATFGFRGPSGSLVCAMDSGRFRRCTSPTTFRGLHLGHHVFRLRAAGETASYGWTIVAPKRRAAASGVPTRPVMTTVPLRPWISRTATFAWQQRARLASECSVDGGAWAGCRSAKTIEHLRLGKHVFRVRTRAQDGRRSRANRFTWTIWPATVPPAPVLLSGPDASTTSTDAVFGFDVRPRDGFECRLDQSGWQQCSNATIYVGLGTGPHMFCVRAIAPSGIAGPATCFDWFVHSPQGRAAPDPTPGAFMVAGDLPGLLSPGTGGPLTLTITNPLAFDLTVTDLVVTVLPGSSRAGCDGPTNLSVTQSNLAGGAVSVVVPAGASVTLPAGTATAPVVTMRNLPTNQDACKGATFSLSYSATGTA